MLKLFSPSGKYFSQSFKLLCGVRQGGVLSPYLFAVCIDSVYQKAAATRAGCYFKGIIYVLASSCMLTI